LPAKGKEEGEKPKKKRSSKSSSKSSSRGAAKARASPSLRVSLELVSTIPCFACKYLFECFPGGRLSPATCQALNEWLEAQMRERSSTSSS